VGWGLPVSKSLQFGNERTSGRKLRGTTQHRSSQYAGAQIALSAVTKKHNASAGLYGNSRVRPDPSSFITSVETLCGWQAG
jgi:hypothetical protein